MDIFERSYYRLNSRLLKTVGLWPYQDPRSRFFRSYFIIGTAIIFIGVMVLKICNCNGDLDVMADVATIVMVVINILLKCYTYHFNVPNMKNLLDNMKINWKTWTSKEEIEILEKYAKKGQVCVTAYGMYLYVVTVLFILLPLLSPIMDVIAPLNESRPMDLPVKAQYLINQEEHFVLLYFHMSCSMIMVMTAFVAADGQLIVFVYHLCSVFSIVGHRLEHLSNFENSKDTLSNQPKDACFKYVVRSIKGHKRAIEFAKGIESSFSYPLFLQCGINIGSLSLTLYRMAMMSFSLEIVRCISFLIAQLFHIFCMTYFGQQVINHSDETSFKAYSGPWYNRSMSISKLLLLVMQSSYKPIKFTAGKVFVLSLEGFATIVQTSTSYFMVLLSLC